ncbi:hypothetical protein F4774DRAFT_268717 [Daldinia eschscholtzii]|nr:hypothetical protein F4774DRAFT_268717 [Daldinia eschscholtzii]
MFIHYLNLVALLRSDLSLTGRKVKPAQKFDDSATRPVPVYCIRPFTHRMERKEKHVIDWLVAAGTPVYSHFYHFASLLPLLLIAYPSLYSGCMCKYVPIAYILGTVIQVVLCFVAHTDRTYLPTLIHSSQTWIQIYILRVTDLR